MVEEYKPKPFKDRDSQNLGPKQFVLHELPILLLPAMGAAAGFGLGKVGVLKGKSIFARAHNLYQKARGLPETAEVQNFLNAGYETYGITTEAAKAQANNVINGLKVGGMASLFLGWQKKEEAKLDLIDVHESLKEVEHLHQTDDDLRKDNHLLKKQIDFMRQQRGEEPAYGHDYPTTRISAATRDATVAPEKAAEVGGPSV